MKRGSQKNENKSLFIANLLKRVKSTFDQIVDKRAGHKISLPDCLMSGLAMFSLKSPSLLAFEKQRHEALVSHNLKTLYYIQQTPSDTYMREVLDEVDHRNLRNSYLSLFEEVQKSKLLKRYEFLGGYLCLVDGSGIFNSEKVHCANCCCKHHKDGHVSYYHQILGAVIAHPDMKQVLPLCPEPITKKDGATKNDCERNASHRFLRDLKNEHPRLKLTICSDALSANAPHINELKALGYSFIIGAKPDGNRSLFSWVKGITREIKMTVKGNTYIFRYVNNVPLNDTENAPSVNFIDCEAIEVEGKKTHKRHFSWVTDHKITDDNVYLLMLGGRARWHIENETFNTLKNQGYQFEHNFGHGKKNLHTVFALLMMLAFLIDQIQEAACGLFQEILKARGSRRALWERLRSLFYVYFIKSWKDLFDAMKPGFKGAVLNTS